MELDLMDLLLEENIYNGLGLQYSEIPTGTLVTKEKTFDISSFKLMKYPVTQQQWKAVMKNNSSYFKGDNLPVENVSYIDVEEYISKVNNNSNVIQVRLPNEWEWEYACRAGTVTTYYFGDTIDGNQTNHQSKGTSPVGKYPPNAFGLYDMHGNVWEWTSSLFDEKKDTRVLRGGSWNNIAWNLRAADRLRFLTGDRSYAFGFRLAIEFK